MYNHICYTAFFESITHHYKTPNSCILESRQLYNIVYMQMKEGGSML